MYLQSIRYGSLVVVVSAWLWACSNSDDEPGNTSSTGGTGDAGASSSAAGEPASAGTGGSKTNQAGSANQSGSGTGGANATEGGSSGVAGSGDGGQPGGVDVEPPSLQGDGIAWTWAGKDYLANKKPHSGFFNAGATANISASDTEDSVPPNSFDLHNLPNMVGTFQCKDYVTALDSSFSVTWLTFDKTANPPNPSFSYDATLPCEFTITRADKGDTSGDIIEGTFKATLRFPGNGVFQKQDRSVAGTMRYTKP